MFKQMLLMMSMVLITVISIGQVNNESQYYEKITLHLDQYAKQKQQADNLFIVGVATTTFGILMNRISKYYTRRYMGYEGYSITGGSLTIIGSSLIGASFLFQMDALKHLKIK